MFYFKHFPLFSLIYYLNFFFHPNKTVYKPTCQLDMIISFIRNPPVRVCCVLAGNSLAPLPGYLHKSQSPSWSVMTYCRWEQGQDRDRLATRGCWNVRDPYLRANFVELTQQDFRTESHNCWNSNRDSTKWFYFFVLYFWRLVIFVWWEASLT